MKTRMKTASGKVHIVSGHPQDFMKMVGGVGVSETDAMLTNVKGRRFKLSEVVSMQVEKE